MRFFFVFSPIYLIYKAFKPFLIHQQQAAVRSFQVNLKNLRQSKRLRFKITHDMPDTKTESTMAIRNP